MALDLNPPQEQLNNLLEHYQTGRLVEAENLAISITQEFPKHPFSWIVLGAVLKQSGRYSEALSANQKAVILSPQDPAAHNNLGNTLKELRKLEQAEASYGQAIILKPDFAEAHNNLGITLKELGKLEEAEASCRQAIVLKPDFAEAYNNLGITFKELGKLEEAEASCRQAIVLKPDFAEAHNNLGNTLQELGKLEEAEVSYGQAIELKSNYLDAHNNLGSILKKLGKYEDAIYQFDLVNNPYSKALSLECLYMNKSYSEYDERLHFISANDDKNIRIAAVSAFTSNQMKKKDPYRFCPDPLDFILIKNLDEYESQSKNLINEIIKESSGYQLIWESRTTKFGYQSRSDIFNKPSKAISNLEIIIQKVVNDYYNNFRSESNIFIKSWPSEYKLYGWFNRLLKNGYQTSHIHPSGWLSGVIYLKTMALNNNEGAIEFGLHGYDLPVIDKDYPRKIHRPKIGDIALFPSSLFHRTIPFSSDSERCVIAFDLMRI